MFTAVYSSRGFANDLLLYAQRGRVGLVLSDFVLVETERNLEKSAPWAVPAFVYIRSNLTYRLRNPSQRLIVDTERVVVTKDAPIIAAARSAHVKLVATYDRKHLLSNRQAILDAFGITVATPDDILTTLRLR
ncbi:MAG TPA: hypothetical protein VH482_32750 [Thermomicrobiales bacterium]